MVQELLIGSWQVLGEMAPWLLFGFLFAGVLSVFVDPVWLERNLGGGGLGPVLKASLFGVPLPLCSCGVIPVAASLRAHGAGRPATVAFLLSTPQTGADSILVTYSLLGPVFAVFRPVAALVTGLIGGGLIRVAGGAERGSFAPVKTDGCGDACEDEACADDTCGDACCEAHDTSSGGGRIARSLRYGLLTLPRDIGLALIVGVLIAGAMGVFFKPDQLEMWIGGGFVSILVMMMAGVPVYVCATASVPIAAALIHAGASPGAALAFLIAGPATNAAALTTVWAILGRRSAVLYLCTVAVSAILCGLLLDWLVPIVGSGLPDSGLATHDHESSGWMTHAWAGVMAALLITTTLGRLRRPAPPAAVEPDRRTTVLEIEGMSCSHCSNSVERALRECAGVTDVVVDLDTGRAVIRGDDPHLPALAASVHALGYTVKTDS